MWPRKIMENPAWCFYLQPSGRTVLVFPPNVYPCPCPHCGAELAIAEFRRLAQCCGRRFEYRFNAVQQLEAIATHRSTITGWRTLRPYKGGLCVQ